MADFCSKCNRAMFGEEIPAGYDTDKMIEDLNPMEVYDGLLCEGCGMTGIGMGKDGELVASYYGKKGYRKYKHDKEVKQDGSDS